MNVALVASMDPEYCAPSGVRAYITNLISQLISRGIDIALIGVSYKKEKNQEYDFDFIPILKKNKISGYQFFVNLLFKAPLIGIAKNTIIHTQRPDHMLPFILFYRKNPKICTLHGAHIKNVYTKKGSIVGNIYSEIEKFVFKRVDILIAVSEDTINYYTRKYSWIKNKIILIPIGINTDLFKPINKQKMREFYGFSNNEKIILYVGRMEKEKGLDILLKSLKKLENEIANLKLVLVGDGRERKKLENLSRDLKLKNVMFMNSLEHDKIPEIMNCADVFVLCSLYEGMPTVVLEALACGVPVVSTDVGDVYKVVKDGVTGYIVKKRTEEEVKNKLMDVLREDKISKENCISSVQEYSWNEISKKIVSVYYEVLEKK